MITAGDAQIGMSELKSDYNNHLDDRFRRSRVGLPSMGAQADYHFRSQHEYYDIIELARDLDRNDAVIGQAVTRLVANTVGTGFTLVPKTGDEKLDEELKYRWKEFAEDPDQCDIAGEWCWGDFEDGAMRDCLIDGDCLVAGTADGPFQYWEAQNIAKWTPEGDIDGKVFLGVELEKRTRRRTRYWVTPDPLFRRTNVKLNSSPLDVRSDGVRQLFHVLDSKRKTLTRGVTALYPVLVVLGFVEDINFAKLVQQQVASCYAILRERDVDAQAALPGSGGYGATHTERTYTGGSREIDDIQPGMEITGDPGETLKGFSPDVPNDGYFEQMRQQLAFIGANLDLSPAQVVLDFTNENFVGYRGAVSEARKGIRRRQQMLIKRLHNPAYVFKVTQWLATDPAIGRTRRRKVDPFRHVWQPPAFDYVEPVSDTKADSMRLRNSLTSRRRLMAERQLDWSTVAVENVEDSVVALRAAAQAAQELNAEFPEAEFTWRDCINLPTAEGVTDKQDGDSTAGEGGGPPRQERK